MKKIGIITPYGNVNHGNKLQNYALKKVLEKTIKCEVYTIKYSPKVMFIKKVIRKIINFNITKRSFKISKINKELNYVNYEKIPNNFFDYIVVGSDQIWNYTFPEFNEEFCFAKKFNCKKISYGASIGKNDISEDYQKIFENNLKKYEKISVREEKGKNALENLGIKNVSVVLDPTLLLDKENWEILSNKSRIKLQKKYIFTYFLGDLSDDFKCTLQEYCKKNNYEIINILDSKSKYYAINIYDFLKLIKNAEMIMCDSFHACVFSFIFNKPFVFYDDNKEERKEMSSRTENFFNVFDLNDRKYLNQEFDYFKKYDYTKSYTKLILEQEKSIKFILESLQ